MFLQVIRKKQDIFTSCSSLRVLAAQEVLAPLLARAFFFGCTVISDVEFTRGIN